MNASVPRCEGELFTGSSSRPRTQRTALDSVARHRTCFAPRQLLLSPPHSPPATPVPLPPLRRTPRLAYTRRASPQCSRQLARPSFFSSASLSPSRTASVRLPCVLLPHSACLLFSCRLLRPPPSLLPALDTLSPSPHAPTPHLFSFHPRLPRIAHGPQAALSLSFPDPFVCAAVAKKKKTKRRLTTHTHTHTQVLGAEKSCLRVRLFVCSGLVLVHAFAPSDGSFAALRCFPVCSPQRLRRISPHARQET